MIFFKESLGKNINAHKSTKSINVGATIGESSGCTLGKVDAIRPVISPRKRKQPTYVQTYYEFV